MLIVIGQIVFERFAISVIKYPFLYTHLKFKFNHGLYILVMVLAIKKRKLLENLHKVHFLKKKIIPYTGFYPISFYWTKISYMLIHNITCHSVIFRRNIPFVNHCFQIIFTYSFFLCTNSLCNAITAILLNTWFWTDPCFLILY